MGLSGHSLTLMNNSWDCDKYGHWSQEKPTNSKEYQIILDRSMQQ